MTGPETNAWVTPLVESYVSRECESAHGGIGDMGVTGTEDTGSGTANTVVFVITARTTVREPEAQAELYGSVTEKICPLPTVKLVAVPMMVPLEL